MSTIRTALSAALLITTGSAFAAECFPAWGTVKLIPDPTCQVTSAFPGQPFMGQPGTCFKVEVTGSLRGSGFAGLTVEQAASLVPGAGGTLTPAVALEAGRPSDPTLPFGTRQFFTARSVLMLRGGKVYTADAGVASGNEAAEQIHIIGGEGFYAGASGTVYLSGNSFEGAPYRGHVCPGRG